VLSKHEESKRGWSMQMLGGGEGNHGGACCAAAYGQQ
jgi:hypothetical protein